MFLFFIFKGKVFSKLNFTLPDDIIQSASASKPGVVEFILTNLRTKVCSSVSSYMQL